MISEGEKSQLRNFIRSDQWRVLLNLKDAIVDNINSQSVLRDTNDEILRTAIAKEASIAALNNFIKEILEQAK